MITNPYFVLDEKMQQALIKASRRGVRVKVLVPGAIDHNIVRQASRRQFGATWTLQLPGFPPVVITTDRDAIKRLFTGDPLKRRHGNDLLRRILGDSSLMLLEPAEHLARRRLELPPFHGQAVRRYGARIRELFQSEIETWRAGELVAQPTVRAP